MTKHGQWRNRWSGCAASCTGTRGPYASSRLSGLWAEVLISDDEIAGANNSVHRNDHGHPTITRSRRTADIWQVLENEIRD
jgi:hypothetical protein